MSQFSPEIRAHLALALVPELGPKRTRALLEHFGTPEAILVADQQQIASVPNISNALSERFLQHFRVISQRVEAELVQLQKHKVGLLPIDDPGYPWMLAQITDRPPLLYTRGQLQSLSFSGIGIVGSRQSTSYGKKMTQQLVRGLVDSGFTIVSGLARGIDGIAHQAALDAGGVTVAVLAGGLGKIYPPEHADLARRIEERGMLISETPMTVDPLPGMFPARNRIISGLCRGVVIMEANERSGALITASHAAEQGREVFVLPGNVDSPASAGCLELIRKGARLIRSADDIIDDLRGLATPKNPQTRPVQPTLFPQTASAPQPAPPVINTLEPELQAVYAALSTPKQRDELARELNLTTPELATLLMKLEMKRLIRPLPGGQFERRS